MRNRLAELSRAVPSPQSERFHEEVLQEKHCLDSSNKKGSSRKGEGREGDKSSCGPKAMCHNIAKIPGAATRLSPEECRVTLARRCRTKARKAPAWHFGMT